tara:strand:+ start:54 stop:215 length:162 start_codon:yes stop_codon:yes gene_type:complete
MGFFKHEGVPDGHWQEWKDLKTGWGKIKYIGREIQTLIGFLFCVWLFFYLISI